MCVFVDANLINTCGNISNQAQSVHRSFFWLMDEHDSSEDDIYNDAMMEELSVEEEAMHAVNVISCSSV